MPFVLDSSVTLSWLLPDENNDKIDALIDRLESDHAVVPAIWPLEVSNALLVAQRRGRIKADELDRLTKALGALPIEVDPPIAPSGLRAILDLAKSHTLTTYDAAYLELARRRHIALATLDARLRAASLALKLAVLP